MKRIRKWTFVALGGAAAISACCATMVSGCTGSSATDADGGSEAGAPTSDANAPAPDATSDGSADAGSDACVPATCAQLGAQCGQVSDGCGGLTPDCGGCPGTQVCGGGGSPNLCGFGPCVRRTCSDPSVSGLCGQQPDGCGGLIATPCVTCALSERCGGAGVPSKCGRPCTPIPAGTLCVADGGVPMNCGVMADGCGNAVPCGTDAGCPAGEFCGGAGYANVCGSSTALPLPDGGVTILDGGIEAGTNLCQPLGITEACEPDAAVVPSCGPVSDGCGNTITCGLCAFPDFCGGSGHYPPICESPCTPATTCPSGIACGPASNGCGGTIASCGQCAQGTACGVGGVPSQCGDAG